MTIAKRKLFPFLAVAFATLLAADAVFAQCAMCRTTLEQNGEMAAGFNKGILFLLAMPYLVFGSIGLNWYLRRRKTEKMLAQQRSAGAPTVVSESPV